MYPQTDLLMFLFTPGTPGQPALSRSMVVRIWRMGGAWGGQPSPKPLALESETTTKEESDGASRLQLVQIDLDFIIFIRVGRFTSLSKGICFMFTGQVQPQQGAPGFFSSVNTSLTSEAFQKRKGCSIQLGET